MLFDAWLCSGEATEREMEQRCPGSRGDELLKYRSRDDDRKKLRITPSTTEKREPSKKNATSTHRITFIYH